MIRTHPNDPPFTVAETAEIARITAVAAMRRGNLTTAQQRRIDRIVNKARERADQQKGNQK